MLNEVFVMKKRRYRRRKRRNPDAIYVKEAIVKTVFSLVILCLSMWLFMFWMESIL